MKKILTVEGMCCMNCVKNVHDAIMKIPEVQSVDVDLKTKVAFVGSDEAIDNHKIKQVVSEAGYNITDIEIV